jgi:MFS transporter, FSR family, fosmidomycin resistance protein
VAVCPLNVRAWIKWQAAAATWKSWNRIGGRTPYSLTKFENHDARYFLLPIVGTALNGTSSVLYGTVPELVATDRRETAFGTFYTATIGAGALSPILYGFSGDALGLTMTTLVTPAVVLVTLPLAGC